MTGSGTSGGSGTAAFERILDAAFSTFAGRGYRDASMDDIASAAETSKGGVYFHFPTKESLLAAVLEERDRVNGEQFFQGSDATKDGLDYFVRLVRVVEMRYFAGLTDAEIGAALGVTDRTVRRDWERARLLLAELLGR